jgi:hypothetical protein
MGQGESKAKDSSNEPKQLQKLDLGMEYGMFVMPLDVFLGIDKIQAHQQLKREGKLIEWTPELDRPVFFLSHQWLSFKHPDPLMEQVKTFQNLLKNLASGSMDVPLSMLHKCSFDCLPTLTGSHWKEVLPNAVVWMDYFSMPQPTVIDEENVAANGSDSRHLSTDLEKAVKSIPSYVENSEYFFVLAPPAKHKDLDVVSDKASWASRGWCRMEAQARALSTHGGPVILVQGAKVAEMMIPAEWYRTPVGQGEFTCCKLGHKLDTPAGCVEIPCDKVKVAQVLEVMFDHKMRTLEANDSLLEWRWLKARKEMLFAGLPHPYAEAQPRTLESFLQEFKFTGVNDGEESGWTPLRFAVIAKDAQLVKDLLAAGASKDTMLKDDAHSLYHQKGSTMLHTAACWGNLETIQPLVEAGSDLTPTISG